VSGWLAGLAGAPGIVASAVWGFAEGTLFFVVPDVLFTRVTITRAWRSLAHVAAATAGALAAGVLMFAWTSRDPAGARAAVAAVPKVGTSMIEATQARLDESGTVAFFDRPLGGVPYKVYAVLAPERMRLPGFLVASLFARLERFAITWAAFAILFVGFVRRRREASEVPAWIHAVFWILVYGYYWLVA
jgi:hypothetical protein